MVIYILFITGFIVLVAGADMLVKGASILAKKLGVGELIIGLTIVAFGTSSPELFVNIFASANGLSDIAIGNVLGSNIFNILVILGLASFVYPLTIAKNTVWKEIPFSLLATLALWVMVGIKFIWIEGHSYLSRLDGIILLLLFLAFIIYILHTAKSDRIKYDVVSESPSFLKPILYITIGLVALLFGAKWVADGAVRIATLMGMSQAFIGLTIVAVGTSLPELATSVIAALKKNSDIAIGNIVGSNIFNILFILGVSSCIKPINFNPKSNIDLGMALFATILLFISAFTGKKRVIDRPEGAVYILAYIGFITYLILSEQS